jgi:hypothetical protein
MASSTQIDRLQQQRTERTNPALLAPVVKGLFRAFAARDRPPPSARLAIVAP